MKRWCDIDARSLRQISRSLKVLFDVAQETVHGSICEIISGLGSEDAMVCERLTGRAAPSRMRPLQLSGGQLDCLALLRFGIEDFDLEIWETSL
jgi:hypothetical protein